MPEEEHGLFEKGTGGGKAGLSKKGPGGIPVWGYGVGIAGLVVAYMYFKGSKTSAATAAAANQQGTSGQPGTGQYGTETVQVSGDGGGGSWYPPWRGWIGGGGGYYGFTPSPSTNEQWGQLVTDWLVSRAENPGDVADTVNDYLDGQRLDTEERAMVDLATNVWGPPPQTPVPVTGDGNGKKRKRHAPKPPDPGPGGPGPGRHDPRSNPGGPRSHTREQTVTGKDGTQTGTGKTVVIVE